MRIVVARKKKHIKKHGIITISAPNYADLCVNYSNDFDHEEPSRASTTYEISPPYNPDYQQYPQQPPQDDYNQECLSQAFKFKPTAPTMS